jgi:hypothetical protein
MSLFDEMDIRCLNNEGDVYVNLSDLADHLYKTQNNYKDEIQKLFNLFPAEPTTVAYAEGVFQGLGGVVTMLAQGGVESYIDYNVNTVDDMLKLLED